MSTEDNPRNAQGPQHGGPNSDGEFGRLRQELEAFVRDDRDEESKRLDQELQMATTEDDSRIVPWPQPGGSDSDEEFERLDEELEAFVRERVARY